ncbi:MAG: hypothetical protein LBI18_05260, partial [Planctomycetaceae bacterium]|nr:hypothetical protein [Planctomycetaceae bacterium]
MKKQHVFIVFCVSCTLLIFVVIVCNDFFVQNKKTKALENFITKKYDAQVDHISNVPCEFLDSEKYEGTWRWKNRPSYANIKITRSLENKTTYHVQATYDNHFSISRTGTFQNNRLILDKPIIDYTCFNNVFSTMFLVKQGESIVLLPSTNVKKYNSCIDNNDDKINNYL